MPDAIEGVHTCDDLHATVWSKIKFWPHNQSLYRVAQWIAAAGAGTCSLGRPYQQTRTEYLSRDTVPDENTKARSV